MFRLVTPQFTLGPREDLAWIEQHLYGTNQLIVSLGLTWYTVTR